MKKLKIDKICDLIDQALDTLAVERQKDNSITDDNPELDCIYSDLLSAHDHLIEHYYTKY